MGEFAKWTGFVVDVEANGPVPGEYSMLEIGAVRLDRSLTTTFSTKLSPLSVKWSPSALKVLEMSLIEMWNISKNPAAAMYDFRSWVVNNTFENTYPMFFSDNNGFDFMFTHWYFVHCGIDDPFGHTSRNIADIYRGLAKNVKKSFKFLRKTKHDHNPVNDAKGNAEALITMVDEYDLEGLEIPE